MGDAGTGSFCRDQSVCALQSCPQATALLTGAKESAQGVAACSSPQDRPQLLTDCWLEAVKAQLPALGRGHEALNFHSSWGWAWQCPSAWVLPRPYPAATLPHPAPPDTRNPHQGTHPKRGNPLDGTEHEPGLGEQTTSKNCSH